MATVKYYPAKGSDIALPDNAGKLLDHDETFAELTTPTSDTVVFTGQGFTYEFDKFVGGTVSEIVFKAYESDAYRITDISWDVALNDLPGAVGGAADISELFAGDDTFIGSRVADQLRAAGGDDLIRGGKGDDFIWGCEGNDTLKGGRDSDTFVFSLGDGADRIVDFETRGPNQDTIRMTNPDEIGNIRFSERYNNVVIEYGDGDKIVLRDVDLDDLSHKNFDAARYFDFG